MPTPIVFVDLREQDLIQKTRLESEQSELQQRKHRNGGNLPDDLEKRLKAISDVLKKAEDRNPAANPNDKVLDPTFRRLRAKLRELTSSNVGEHVGGQFPTQLQAPPVDLTEEEKTLAAIYGLLESDGILNTYDERLDNQQLLVAAVNRLAGRPQAALPAAVLRFDESISKALGEYTAHQALFRTVLQVLVNDGDISQDQQYQADQWVRVVRALKNDRIPANDPLLPLKVRIALGKVAGASAGIPSSTMAIDLPLLDDRAGVEITKDILEGVQPWIFSMPLEEMGFFNAMDMALEDWQNGLIVLGRGPAGDRFYNYWRESHNRLSELERRTFYARLFGIPGGAASQQLVNKDFKSLWIRFLAAVSRFYRQIQVDSLLQSSIPVAVSQEQVRQSGRDLAANLCVNAHGFTPYAGLELQQQIEEIITALSADEVKRNYGAGDMFQVIEQVLSSRGVAIGNTVQKRVSANSGAIIVRWLAENGLKLSSAALGEVLDIQSLRNPMPRLPGTKATTTPTDYDLVNAVEQWLAVNGIQEQYIEEQAQAMRAAAHDRPAVPNAGHRTRPDRPTCRCRWPPAAGNGGRPGNGPRRWLRLRPPLNGRAP